MNGRRMVRIAKPAKMTRALVMLITCLVGTAARSEDRNYSRPLDEPGFILGINAAFDQPLETGDKEVPFYGLEVSFEKHFLQQMTLGATASCQFHFPDRGSDLMIFEPGMRLGVLIDLSDRLWLHPYGTVGVSVYSKLTERCDIDGSCSRPVFGFFAGAGIGLRWIVYKNFGVSTDIGATVTYYGFFNIKVRAGVVLLF